MKKKSDIPSLPILFDILCHSNLSLAKFGVDDSHLRSQRMVVAGWGNTDVITTEKMLKAYTTPRLFWHITCKMIRKKTHINLYSRNDKIFHYRMSFYRSKSKSIWIILLLCGFSNWKKQTFCFLQRMIKIW